MNKDKHNKENEIMKMRQMIMKGMNSFKTRCKATKTQQITPVRRKVTQPIDTDIDNAKYHQRGKEKMD